MIPPLTEDTTVRLIRFLCDSLFMLEHEHFVSVCKFQDHVWHVPWSDSCCLARHSRDTFSRLSEMRKQSDGKTKTVKEWMEKVFPLVSLISSVCSLVSKAPIILLASSSWDLSASFVSLTVVAIFSDFDDQVAVNSKIVIKITIKSKVLSKAF